MSETPFDLDGDGNPDVIEYDYDGDGAADETIIDMDGDGVFETTLIDLDGDGYQETIISVEGETVVIDCRIGCDETIAPMVAPGKPITEFVLHEHETPEQ